LNHFFLNYLDDHRRLSEKMIDARGHEKYYSARLMPMTSLSLNSPKKGLDCRFRG